MKYTVELTRKATKDLRDIPKSDRARILKHTEALGDNLVGDVKKLTNHTPEFRMRWGDWRVLFEVEGGKVIIYRVLHRRESCR